MKQKSFCLGLAVLFRTALFFLGRTSSFLFLALAVFFRQAQAFFLSLALEARNTLLRSFRRRCSLLGRRLGRRGDRRRRRRRWRRRRCDLAGLADQAATLLHFNHNLVGAAVAEGLFDLASIDRTLKAKRLTGRFLFFVAHLARMSFTHSICRLGTLHQAKC